jgi:glyoxylase I family protein
MAIEMKTPGVHHVTLRVSNLPRTKTFYVETLGFRPLMDTPELLLVLAGGTAIGFRAPTDQMPRGDAFSPHRIGVDHIALACSDEGELERVAKALEKAGVDNTGAKMDPTLGKRYVAFKDPDRIAWEFYMA